MNSKILRWVIYILSIWINLDFLLVKLIFAVEYRNRFENQNLGKYQSKIKVNNASQLSKDAILVSDTTWLRYCTLFMNLTSQFRLSFGNIWKNRREKWVLKSYNDANFFSMAPLQKLRYSRKINFFSYIIELLDIPKTQFNC